MKLTAHFRKPEASASRIALVLNSYEDVPNGGGFFENSSDLFKSALPRYRRHPTKHKTTRPWGMYSGMYPSRNSCNSMGISLIRLPRISLFQAMISRRSRCLALDSIHSATASSLAPRHKLLKGVRRYFSAYKEIIKGQSKCYSPFVPASTERHLSSVRLTTTYPARFLEGLAEFFR